MTPTDKLGNAIVAALTYCPALTLIVICLLFAACVAAAISAYRDDMCARCIKRRFCSGSVWCTGRVEGGV